MDIYVTEMLGLLRNVFEEPAHRVKIVSDREIIEESRFIFFIFS
jgi:hypothetical protein